MTIAPRLEVFTQLACGTIHGHYNHTTLIVGQTMPLPTTSPVYHSLHFPQPSEPTTIHVSTLPVNANNTAPEDDPRNLPSEWCMSDPSVQAGAARLQTMVTTIMGTLSALTTTWWGGFGERYGRTRVMAIATLGLFLTDLMFILLSTPHTIFAKHGHALLIVAPFIEGLLGGWTTLHSATISYISDCTSDGSRAQIFSRFSGVTFLGLAAGPLLGAFLIQHPLKFFQDPRDPHPIQNVTSVFWVSIALSFLNLLFVAFVFPESLSKAEQAANRAPLDVNVEDVDAETPQNKAAGGGIISSLLRPFAVFMPRTVTVAGRNSKKDWNLTFLALSIFGSMLGSVSARHCCVTFDHRDLTVIVTTGCCTVSIHVCATHIRMECRHGEFYYLSLNLEKLIISAPVIQLSYYISWLGGLRAVYLLFVLPCEFSSFFPLGKHFSPSCYSCYCDFQAQGETEAHYHACR